MELIAALLVCLVVKAAHALDFHCLNAVNCPCGSEGVNITVCVPDASVHEEVCASLSKCENCDEGFCSKCPEGLKRPFCSPEPTVYINHPQDLANGEMVNYPVPNEMRRPMESMEQFLIASRLRYPCDGRSTREGPDILECLMQGIWSAKTQRCVTDRGSINCKSLGKIENGRVEYFPPTYNEWSGSESKLYYQLRQYPQGSVAEYHCNVGYKLIGRLSLTCRWPSVWSAKPPVCKQDCGRSFMQMTENVLINDVNTTSVEWPWVVSIYLDDNGSSPPICEGALLNTHTVITAAHCLVRNRTLLLRFGRHRFNVRDDDREVLTRTNSRFIIHPEYSMTTFDADIALIYFHPIILYSVRVQPICLPTTYSTIRSTQSKQIGYVGCWAETERVIPPEKMMLARMAVVSNEECMDAYKQPNLVITSSMFCAGYEDSRQSVCGRVSGSPFVFYNKLEERYTLEGLVSFGVSGQGGVAGKYTIFTNVMRFQQWITENLKYF